MRSILVIAFALFIISESKAQLDISIKAGANSSDIVWKTTNNTLDDSKYFQKNIWGYQAGFSTKYQLGGKLTLLTELLYTKKGARSTHLNYINLPIGLGYQFGRFSFEIGTEFAYLLFARLKTDQINEKITSAYSRFDLSLMSGIAFSISDKIDLNLRYVRGLIPSSSITFTDDGTNGPEVKEYTRSVQLSIAFKLN